MEDEYQICSVDNSEPDVIGVIGPGLRAYNVQQTGDGTHQPVVVALRAPDGTIVGGIAGTVYWNWLELHVLWVKEELRKRGYGHRLLAAAEEEGRRRGAQNAFLDTFSFQAPEFYKRYGYEVFGELENYPGEAHRYFLKKRL